MPEGKLRIAAENGKSVFSSFLRKKRTYLYAKQGAIMKQTERPIAVFDSGVGGISVLRELVRLMPNENYIFFGDSKNAPYGGKSLEEVRKLTECHGETSSVGRSKSSSDCL